MFALLVLLMAPTRAMDAEEVFDEAEKETDLVDKPGATLSAEFGASITGGNTQTTVLSGSVTGGYRWDGNGLSGQGLGEYGRSIVDADGDGTLSAAERRAGYQRTAQKLAVDLRYDRYLDQRDSLYLLAGYLNDPFSGYELRVHGQTGFSRSLVDTHVHTLTGELGFDVAREVYTSGVVPAADTRYYGRGFLGWVGTLNDSAQFGQSLEAFDDLENFSDIRLISETALTVRASEILSLKAGYRVEYDSVPVSGYRNTDQKLAITLVASLFGNRSDDDESGSNDGSSDAGKAAG